MRTDSREQQPSQSNDRSVGAGASRVGFYLHVVQEPDTSLEELTQETVFNFIQCTPDELEILNELWAKQFPITNKYFCVPANGMSVTDRILLDEAIENLRLYDEPDPGVYVPRPTPKVLERARLVRCTDEWLARLRADQNARDAARKTDLNKLCRLATGYCEMIKSVRGLLFFETDIELIHRYSWIICEIERLLSHSPHLRDLPVKFAPALPDMAQATLRSSSDFVEVAESFVAKVFKLAHEKGMRPIESPIGGDDEIKLAVDAAHNYRSRSEATSREFAGLSDALFPSRAGDRGFHPRPQAAKAQAPVTGVLEHKARQLYEAGEAAQGAAAAAAISQPSAVLDAPEPAELRTGNSLKAVDRIKLTDEAQAVLRRLVKSSKPLTTEKLTGDAELNMGPDAIKTALNMLRENRLIERPTRAGFVPTDRGFDWAKANPGETTGQTASQTNKKS
jgi:hypothetical protein